MTQTKRIVFGVFIGGEGIVLKSRGELDGGGRLGSDIEIRRYLRRVIEWVIEKVSLSLGFGVIFRSPRSRKSGP